MQIQTKRFFSKDRLRGATISHLHAIRLAVVVHKKKTNTETKDNVERTNVIIIIRVNFDLGGAVV